jgi:hypothetical protein
MTQTTVQKLTGDDLIAHTEKCLNDGMTRTDLIIQAGYVAASGRTEYTAFYEALLAAKRIANPDLYDPPTEAETETYDNLSKESQKLYDRLSEGIGRSWSHSEQLDFMETLAEDLGIDTLNGFDDAFYSYIDNQWSAESEFAEEFCQDLENLSTDSLYYAAIDWQKVWDHNLSYDFNTIEFDGCTYFFRNV